MDDPGQLLAQLTHLVARGSASTSLATRLCQAAVDLTGFAGGAITYEYAAETRMTVCVTDPVASRLEDLQEVLGEGPGWDAARELAIVEVQLSTATRWPSFVPAAMREVGDQILHCVPMRPSHQMIGVMSLHGEPTAPPVADRELEQFLADAVGAALLREPDIDEIDAGGPWLRRARVHQATGMTAAQLGLTTDDAMAVLRAHAFALDTSLDDVASEVVTRRLVFQLPDDDDRSGLDDTTDNDTTDNDTTDSEAEDAPRRRGEDHEDQR